MLSRFQVDVLRTIKACLEEYQDVAESITPYTNRIWTSLKYEVRNGEIEDTIWATLEVLKTLAIRLTGDDLRDYTLTVTRDCVADLATPMYTTSAGRLLVSVLSANPASFVLIVAPAITHIKENLRHPKSHTHSLDLLKILRIILETRLLLTNVDMAEQDRTDYAAVDGAFKPLYTEVYKNPLGLALKEEVSEEDLKMSTEAIQGLGALLGQRVVQSLTTTAGLIPSAPLLLPASTLCDSCDSLFRIATKNWDERARRNGADNLVNEAAKALQRIIQAYPEGFQPLMRNGTKLIRQSIANLTHESLELIQSLGPLLAYIGCSSVSGHGSESMAHYLDFTHAIITELLVAIDGKASPRIWCALVTGINSSVRFFNDACLERDAASCQVEASTTSLDEIATKYPQLSSIGSSAENQSATSAAAAAAAASMASFTSLGDARSDALLASLYTVGLLYKRATQTVVARGELSLSADFGGSEDQQERRYLYLLSECANFVIHELSESQQAALEVEAFSFNLFRGNDVDTSSSTSSWNWLTHGPLNVLCLGILEALRPSRIAKLVRFFFFFFFKFIDFLLLSLLPFYFLFSFTIFI